MLETDWLDDVPEGDEEKAPAPLSTVEDDDRAYEVTLQSDLFDAATRIVSDAMRFVELEPGAKEPPESWVKEHGKRRATEIFRVASAAWMSKRDAPMGLEMAHRQVLGILKVRAAEQSAPKSLSVTLVQAAAPAQLYPEKEIVEVKKGGYG